MSNQPTNTFTRVLPKNDLFHGHPLRAILLGLCGAVLTCGLLFHLYLLMDLLHHRGQLPAHEALELSDMLGEETPVAGLANAQPLENGGLLPTVYWALKRPSFWAGPLKAIAQWSPMRTNSAALMVIVFNLLILAILRALVFSRVRAAGQQTGIEIVSRLRRNLHRQALRLGPSDLANNETTYIVGIFGQPLETLREEISSWVESVARYPAHLIFVVLYAMSFHVLGTIEWLLPLGACWFLLHRERLRAVETKRIAAERSAKELNLLVESFHKTRLVRGFGMESFEHDGFQRNLDRHGENISRIKQNERLSIWLARLIVFVVLAIVVYFISVKVLLEPHDLSEAAAFVMIVIFTTMYFPLVFLRQAWDYRKHGSQVLDQVYQYLDRVPEVSQAIGAKFLEPLSQSIQFDNVHYGVGANHSLLNALSLKIKSGEVTAFIGLNDAEVRALTYMLPRFIEPNEGKVLIDGQDIAWVTLESLRAEAIYVGGQDLCFTGTVTENICCGTKYKTQAVMDAAKLAHAHHFILKLPQGYETMLGEHGETLDAGQVFRLGLTRAILRKPALLIIEEPSVTLDDDTKSLIDDAYTRLIPKRTVLFLPSRLSTVRKANRIVILRNGRVAETGSYQELVKTSALYRHWEYLRFNDFRNES